MGSERRCWEVGREVVEPSHTWTSVGGDISPHSSGRPSTCRATLPSCLPFLWQMPPFPSTIPTSRTFPGKLHRAAVTPQSLAPIRPGSNQDPYKPRPLPCSKLNSHHWTTDRCMLPRWTTDRCLPPKCGEQKRGHNNVLPSYDHLNSILIIWTRGGCGLDLAHPVLWRRKSPGCNPTSSPGAGMKGFAGSQDLCEELTRSNPQQGTNKNKTQNVKKGPSHRQGQQTHT